MGIVILVVGIVVFYAACYQKGKHDAERELGITSKRLDELLDPDRRD